MSASVLYRGSLVYLLTPLSYYSRIPSSQLIISCILSTMLETTPTLECLAAWLPSLHVIRLTNALECLLIERSADHLGLHSGPPVLNRISVGVLQRQAMLSLPLWIGSLPSLSGIQFGTLFHMKLFTRAVLRLHEVSLPLPSRSYKNYDALPWHTTLLIVSYAYMPKIGLLPLS